MWGVATRISHNVFMMIENVLKVSDSVVMAIIRPFAHCGSQRALVGRYKRPVGSSIHRGSEKDS